MLLFNHAAHVLRSICMNVCVLHLGFIDQSDNVSFVSYVYFVLKKNIFLLLQMPLESEFLHQDAFVLQNFRLEIIEKYISLLNTMTQFIHHIYHIMIFLRFNYSMNIFTNNYTNNGFIIMHNADIIFSSYM